MIPINHSSKIIFILFILICILNGINGKPIIVSTIQTYNIFNVSLSQVTSSITLNLYYDGVQQNIITSGTVGNDTWVLFQVPQTTSAGNLYVQYQGVLSDVYYLYVAPVIVSVSEVSPLGCRVTVSGANLNGVNLVTIDKFNIYSSSFQSQGWNDIIFDLPKGGSGTNKTLVAYNGQYVSNPLSFNFTEVIFSVYQSDPTSSTVTVVGDSFDINSMLMYPQGATRTFTLINTTTLTFQLKTSDVNGDIQVKSSTNTMSFIYTFFKIYPNLQVVSGGNEVPYYFYGNNFNFFNQYGPTTVTPFVGANVCKTALNYGVYVICYIDTTTGIVSPGTTLAGIAVDGMSSIINSGGFLPSVNVASTVQGPNKDMTISITGVTINPTFFMMMVGVSLVTPTSINGNNITYTMGAYSITNSITIVNGGTQIQLPAIYIAPYIISSTTPAYPSGGNVTLTGYYFNYVSGLILNGSNVPFNSLTLTSLVFTAPSLSIGYNQPLSVVIYTNRQKSMESNVFMLNYAPYINSAVSRNQRELLITGSYLGSNPIINFNNANYTSYQLSDSTYIIIMPDDAKSGLVKAYRSDGVVSNSIASSLYPIITAAYSVSATPNDVTITGMYLSIVDYTAISLPTNVLIGSLPCTNVIGVSPYLIVCTASVPQATSVSLSINGLSATPITYSKYSPVPTSYTQSGTTIVVNIANGDNVPGLNMTFDGQNLPFTYTNQQITFTIPLQSKSGSSFVLVENGVGDISAPFIITLKPVPLPVINAPIGGNSNFQLNGFYFELYDISKTTIILGGTTASAPIDTVLLSLIVSIPPAVNPTVSSTLQVVNNGIISDVSTILYQPKLNKCDTKLNYNQFLNSYSEQIILYGYNLGANPNVTFNGVVYSGASLTFGTVSSTGENTITFTIPNKAFSDNVTVTTAALFVTQPVECLLKPLITSVYPAVPLAGGYVTISGRYLHPYSYAGYPLNVTVKPSPQLSSSGTNITNNGTALVFNMLSVDWIYQFTFSPITNFNVYVVIQNQSSNSIVYNYSPPTVSSITQTGLTLDVAGGNFGSNTWGNRVSVLLPYSQELVPCIYKLTNTNIVCHIPSNTTARNGDLTFYRDATVTTTYTMRFAPLISGITMARAGGGPITITGQFVNAKNVNNQPIKFVANTTTGSCNVLLQQSQSNSIVCQVPPGNFGTLNSINMTIDNSAVLVKSFDTANPIIQSTTGCKYNETTTITVQGDNFVAPVGVTIGGIACVNVTVDSYTQIRCDFNCTAPPPTDGSPLNVDVQVKGNRQGNAQVFLYSSPQICDGGDIQCSGHGDCIGGQCICYANFTDVYCQTPTNKTAPDTPNTTPDSGSFSASKLSVYFTHIRVLDLVGNIVVTLPIANIQSWNITDNQVTSSWNVTTYVAEYPGIPDLVLKVQTYVFTDRANLTFAGELMVFEKNSIKFQVEIDAAGYLEVTQSMEMIYAFTQPSQQNDCSSTNTQTNYNDISNLKWMTGQFGGKTLVSKFSQRVIVDNKVIVSNTRILGHSDSIYQQSVYKSNSLLAVALSVPSFRTTAQVDPSFSLLMNDGNGENESECSQPKKSLWWIAVVIGGVAIGAGVAVFIYKRKRTTKEHGIIARKLNNIKN